MITVHLTPRQVNILQELLSHRSPFLPIVQDEEGSRRIEESEIDDIYALLDASERDADEEDSAEYNDSDV